MNYAPELTHPLGGSRTVKPLGAIVRVLDAPAEPPWHRLDVGTCTIGSSSPCDVVIHAPTVSRAHVELSLVSEGVSVRDLGSRNGTYFQGQRVERITLSLGSKLTLGGVTIAIEADTSAIDEAAEDALTYYRGIVAISSPMRRLFSALRRLEGSLVTVLVEGESGVGKERVAAALHEGSSVANGPFVSLNCGAFPRELISSELFGHKRGAFSGALENRRGAFEIADGGTLFLDEIGELPLEMQPTLLRVLETGEVRPVGEERTRSTRVRIIAATNRDLSADARSGKFRSDLFYRLGVVRLRVPPLAERREDIEPLAMHFAREAGLPSLPTEILEELTRRTYPGNARELRNVIQAYAALGALPDRERTGVLELERVLDWLAIDVGRPYAEQKEELTETFTKLYLRRLLERTRSNQSEAARVSGINRTYLIRLLGKHGLLRGGES
jgi:DNA-binding NtrC family response regulator